VQIGNKTIEKRMSVPFAAFGLFGLMYGIWQVLLAELQRSMGLSDGALGRP
jgi:hypothetical protein